MAASIYLKRLPRFNQEENKKDLLEMMLNVYRTEGKDLSGTIQTESGPPIRFNIYRGTVELEKDTSSHNRVTFFYSPVVSKELTQPIRDAICWMVKVHLLYVLSQLENLDQAMNFDEKQIDKKLNKFFKEQNMSDTAADIRSIRQAQDIIDQFKNKNSGIKINR